MSEIFQFFYTFFLRFQKKKKKMATKFIEGKDWKKLDYVGMQGNLHIYTAICLHCHLCFKSHRSIATHALLCPLYPPNMEKKSNHVVEKIIKHKIENNDLSYLVHWKNQKEKDSWVLSTKLENAHAALREYWNTELPPIDPVPRKFSSKGKNSKSRESSEDNQEDEDDDLVDDSDSDTANSSPSPNDKSNANKVVVYAENQVCVETQTRKKDAPRSRKHVEVLDVVRFGDDLRWTIVVSGKTKELSNAEMKMKYLPAVVNFYESNTSFTAPCEKLHDSVTSLFASSTN